MESNDDLRKAALDVLVAAEGLGAFCSIDMHSTVFSCELGREVTRHYVEAWRQSESEHAEWCRRLQALRAALGVSDDEVEAMAITARHGM